MSHQYVFVTWILWPTWPWKIFNYRFHKGNNKILWTHFYKYKLWASKQVWIRNFSLHFLNTHSSLTLCHGCILFLRIKLAFKASLASKMPTGFRQWIKVSMPWRITPILLLTWRPCYIERRLFTENSPGQLTLRFAQTRGHPLCGWDLGLMPTVRIKKQPTNPGSQSVLTAPSLFAA